MAVLTAKEFQVIQKKGTEEKSSVPFDIIIQKDIKPNVKYFLQHPDQAPGNSIDASMVVDTDGKRQEIIFENGRAVITDKKIAETLIKKGFIEYRRRIEEDDKRSNS